MAGGPFIASESLRPPGTSAPKRARLSPPQPSRARCEAEGALQLQPGTRTAFPDRPLRPPLRCHTGTPQGAARTTEKSRTCATRLLEHTPPPLPTNSEREPRAPGLGQKTLPAPIHRRLLPPPLTLAGGWGAALLTAALTQPARSAVGSLVRAPHSPPDLYTAGSASFQNHREPSPPARGGAGRGPRGGGGTHRPRGGAVPLAANRSRPRQGPRGRRLNGRERARSPRPAPLSPQRLARPGIRGEGEARRRWAHAQESREAVLKGRSPRPLRECRMTSLAAEPRSERPRRGRGRGLFPPTPLSGREGLGKLGVPPSSCRERPGLECGAAVTLSVFPC
ncbi:serine/arginine repetitive matrix protein 3-like [Onychostruthus taczanowskii]|uniref:serine/arginine repetitive matrix protein 3-like n=1 Tax=Onychostruthus taczanowskii TaxID=356909 RepID=UPI001B80787E|nr:serine/arginine repetitive matrix protein 3-like [Onychostruthus taczanowskii]